MYLDRSTSPARRVSFLLRIVRCASVEPGAVAVSAVHCGTGRLIMERSPSHCLKLANVSSPKACSLLPAQIVVAFSSSPILLIVSKRGLLAAYRGGCKCGISRCHSEARQVSINE